MSRTVLRGLVLGIALGVVLAVTAAIERHAFIPYSTAIVVVLVVGMLAGALGLSFVPRRRNVATFLFIQAVALFATFYGISIVVLSHLER